MDLSQARRMTWAARQVARANFTRLEVPLKITFAATYWCQYRCKTCNIWQRKPEGELSTDEVLTFIRKTEGVSWLDVTGGEIFLRKDVGELLEAFVSSWRQLVLLHFPTNGFLTDRIVDVCERLAARGGPQIIVTVSVDGDEALNDETRGIRGGYQRQMETFRALRRIRGIRPVFGMTLSSHNVGRFAETLRACQQECPGLDVTDFHLNVAQLSQHYYGNAGTSGVVPERAGIVSELRLYRDMRGAPRSLSDLLESEYLRRLERYVQTNDMPMRCHSLRSSCFIDPFGTVFPCITYSRPIGQLRETGMDLGAIWRRRATAAVQSEIWEGQCPQCWTACEAYQSILGNVLRPGSRTPVHRASAGPLHRIARPAESVPPEAGVPGAGTSPARTTSI